MKYDSNINDLNKMIERYLAGKANADEIKFVESYYKYLDQKDNILDQFDQKEVKVIGDAGFNSILNHINKPKRKKAISFYKYVAAAVILVALSASFLLFNNQIISVNQKIVVKNKKIDVLPGVDKAILTLADGTKIILDDTKNEDILAKTGLTITKTKTGQLIYKVDNILTKNAIAAFNTIETANGNQYQILLPDGTKVWLNSASSLKYPEFFNGSERQVFLTGEAYFEVAKNKQMPFKVINKGQNVKVLGTHFNINSYQDQQMVKTTLVEGQVSVSNLNSIKVLKPGEQSLTPINGIGDIFIRNIDIDSETAWKNGLFNFNNADLKSILHQLERWYDVKIDYQTVPNKRFNGMVPRKAKLSEVLNMLALTGNISFEIQEGKSIKVISKL